MSVSDHVMTSSENKVFKKKIVAILTALTLLTPTARTLWCHYNVSVNAVLEINNTVITPNWSYGSPLRNWVWGQLSVRGMYS